MMVGALVRILTAVVFLFFTFFLDKTYVFRQVLVLRVLGLGSRLQEVRPTIPARGGSGGEAPQLSAIFSLAYRLPQASGSLPPLQHSQT